MESRGRRPDAGVVRAARPTYDAQRQESVGIFHASLPAAGLQDARQNGPPKTLLPAAIRAA